MRLLACSILLLILSIPGFSQTTTPVDSLKKQTVLVGEVKGSDTIPVYYMADVVYSEKLDEATKEHIKNYWRIVRDVRITMPYAQAAAKNIEKINAHLATLKTNHQRKKYLDAEEDTLRSKFEDDLKNLTFTQGRILIKLIDRQTGHISYSLIKEYKSGFTAFFWQGFARIFGMNLKSKYDPNGKDAYLEQIVKMLGYR